MFDELKMIKFHLCSIFYIALFLHLSSGINMNGSYSNGVGDELELMEKLERALPKYTPPLDMLAQTVFIFIDLYNLQDVDEKNGALTLKLWLYYYYYSSSARWDKSEYNNISSLLVPPGTFWTADIVPLDAIEVNYEAFDRQFVDSVTGLVSCWSSFVTIKTSCPFDVRDFPYDSHHCVISFGPWNSISSMYRLKTDPFFNLIQADLTYYVDHDEWDLLTPVAIAQSNRTWRGIREFDIVTMDLKIKRRHLFYSIVFVMPNFLLYLMSALVFLLPVESGEKVSFSITILLAEIVSFGSISDILPASSLNFPRIAYFLCAAVIQTALSSLFTILVINVHYAGGKHKMGMRTRKLISSRYMYLFGLIPCSKEKTFPGKDEDNCEVFDPNKNSVRPQSKSTDVTKASERWASARSRISSRLRTNSNKVSIESDTESKSELPTDDFKLRSIVDRVTFLESETNMAILWVYFAHLLDRIFLAIHLILSVTVIVLLLRL